MLAPAHAMIPTSSPAPALPASFPTPPPVTPAPLLQPNPPRNRRGTLAFDVARLLRLPNHGPPELQWDIWRLSDSALHRTNRGIIYRLDSTDLNAAATNPPTEAITITCRVGAIADFWPEFTVGGRSIVTVDDVLDAIYRHFHTVISDSEFWEIMRMNRKNGEVLTNAQRDRGIHANQLYETATREGPRRIDCLGDDHYFKGLQVEHGTNDMCKLELHLDSVA